MLTCYSEIEDVNELKSRLPYKPYCSNNLKKGLLVRPRETALKHKYIQLNPPHLKMFLTFDLDYSTWAYVAEDFHLPQPLWCVGNPHNGHAHLIYVLRNPVLTMSAAHVKPLRFLQAIINAYSERLQADPMYSGLISKNPWSDKWKVEQTCDTLYDLEFLADSVWKELSSKPMKKPVEEIAGLGRNCYIFENVRVWSYRAIRDFWARNRSLSDWNDAVEHKCLEENAKFSVPLDKREVRQIARSISRWTWRHLNPDGFREWQRKIIERRWSKESQKELGLELLQSGLSAVEVSEALGVSQRTCRRWNETIICKDSPQALHKVQPWQELGISKTWYYELKKRGDI